MWSEEIVCFEEGVGITVKGKVPDEAEFFQDHFPDFPILPGVLMLEILKKAAELYSANPASLPKVSWPVREVKNVKFSNFLRPGDEWECRLEIVSAGQEHRIWRGKILSAGKSICAAQIKFQSFEVVNS